MDAAEPSPSGDAVPGMGAPRGNSRPQSQSLPPTPQGEAAEEERECVDEVFLAVRKMTWEQPHRCVCAVNGGLFFCWRVPAAG